MKAGQLDQRVTLEQRDDGQDEYGQPIESWTSFASVWACVEPLQGREFIAAHAAVSEVTARVRIRYLPGVTPAMRVLHDEDVYWIEAVIHVKSGKRELQLMCKRVV